MLAPNTLRIWCKAAMAPALTETATQARVKLTGSSPAAGNDSELSSRQSAVVGTPVTLTTPTNDPQLGSPSKLQIQNIKHLASLETARSFITDNKNIASIGLLKLDVSENLSGILRSIPSTSKVGDTSPMNQTATSQTTGGGNHGLTGTLSSSSSSGAGTIMAPKTSRSNSVTTDTPSMNPTSSSANSMARPPVEDSGPCTPILSSSTERTSIGVCNNLVNETSKRQRELERRADRLMRRIRRLQTRQALSHVQKQLSGFVDHQHRSLQSMAKSIKTPQQVPGLDLKAEFLQSEDVKSLSTAALVNLVRKLQTNQAMSLRQRLTGNSSPLLPETSSVLKLEGDLCSELRSVAGNLQANVHHVESAVDSDATESSSGGESCDELDFDDWDGKVPRPALTRRSEWKWASNRAGIASRWTWLHAQVSDLEYRIRQQGEIYRQIRATKGAVSLGEQPPTTDLSSIRLVPPTTSTDSNQQQPQPKKRMSPIEAKIADLERKNEMSPCNLSTLLSNVDKQSSRLTRQLGCVYTPSSSPVVNSSTQSSSAGGETPKTPIGTPNGFVDTSHSASRGVGAASDGKASGVAVLHFDTPSPVSDSSCQAARCRPVQSYRKRKILRTVGLHQASRKAARLSTVRCNCFPPAVPCVMCSGRYHNVESLELEMPVPQRVALLDHSYHAVLSFKQDVPLSVNFGALLKSGDWQRAAARASKLLSQDKKRARLTNGGEPRVPRKYNKRVPKNASAAILSSTKIKNKYDRKEIPRAASLPTTPRANRTDNRLCMSEVKIKRRRAGMHNIESVRKKKPFIRLQKSLSARNTPSPSPSQQGGGLLESKESLRRRRGENAFDIDNIVIPYSMAAATRVEKLQYKEILTPKWRTISSEKAQKEEEVKELVVSSGEETVLPLDEAEEEIEDLTDELFAQRHLVCEISEKKRFIPLSAKPRRNRSSTRTDSITSTNTDPISPDLNASISGDIPLASQLVTPPSTPGNVHSKLNSDTDMDTIKLDSMRVRSGSTSSRADSTDGFPQRRDSFRGRAGSNCEERTHYEQITVTPWEKRLFPLQDVDYLDLFNEAPTLNSPVRNTRSGSCSQLQFNDTIKRVQSLPVFSTQTAGTPSYSEPGSPLSSSSTSEVLEDDPNDPEWTVVSDVTKPLKEMPLVLKLSKR